MKSIRPVFWSLIVVFLVTIVVQNLGLFTYKASLRLNLPLIKEYHTVPIHLSIYFLGFFLIGLLISYVHGLVERFKANRTIKKHLETIRKLEEEIKTFKNLPAQDTNTPSKETLNA
jgi:uncharacterized integral membrane protein